MGRSIMLLHGPSVANWIWARTVSHVNARACDGGGLARQSTVDRVD